MLEVSFKEIEYLHGLRFTWTKIADILGISRSRVRASIYRVDPINTAIRRSVTIRRCVYCVESPNSLWHIDGNHKLIKWRLVIHGGVDGFSRTIVYLRCSTNNETSSVMTSYVDAISIYALPDQVRSDQRGENIEMWRYSC